MFLIFFNTKLHFFFDKSDKKTKKKLKGKEASLAGSLLERWLELRYNEVDFWGIFLFGITVLRYYGISFFLFSFSLSFLFRILFHNEFLDHVEAFAVDADEVSALGQTVDFHALGAVAFA